VPEPDRTIRASRLKEQGKDGDVRSMTPAQRMDMMWQLAVDAWAFMGKPVDESQFSRTTVRLLRRER